MPTELPPKLFELPGMRIQQGDVKPDQLKLVLQCNSASARCPSCHAVSHCVHSHYGRHVEDLPCSGRRVCLEIDVRRFRCLNPDCTRCTFAEPLSFAGRLQRRSTRLQRVLWHVGLALGGSASARLIKQLGITVSDDTILRTLKATAANNHEPTHRPVIRKLGIDDWAFRRGHHYGTILVDLERSKPIELLPDRETQTAAACLQHHPALRVVTRDRSGAYAEAIRQGAPQARQVADRWHLLKNLGEALERMLVRCHTLVKEAARNTNPNAQAASTPAAAGKIHLTKSTSLIQQRRARRLARYEQVRQYRHAGMSISSIARVMRLDRRTVRHWLRGASFPERAARPTVPSKVDPYRDHLMRRWKEGCQNAAILLTEIAQQGYRGSRSTLRRALQSWRSGKAPTSVKAPAVPSPRRAAAWLMDWVKPASEEVEFRTRFVNALCRLSPPIGMTRQLAHEFVAMVKKEEPAHLRSWMRRTQAAGIPELRQFTTGLEQDFDAVRAALTTRYSNGMVEGHINRLKTLKRQMYGRAGLALLRIRVLYPA